MTDKSATHIVYPAWVCGNCTDKYVPTPVHYTGEGQAANCYFCGVRATPDTVRTYSKPDKLGYALRPKEEDFNKIIHSPDVRRLQQQFMDGKLSTQEYADWVYKRIKEALK